MISFYPAWLTTIEADQFLEKARNYSWEQRTVLVWDKPHLTPRLTIYYNDAGEGYRYSNQTTPAQPWTPELLEIRKRLEIQAGVGLQACLANWYRSGADTVGWHTDADHIFNTKPTIVSLTCGATRKFRLRDPDTGETQDFQLGHGDLLVLTDEHVLRWKHCVPKTAKPVEARLNFTFRSCD